MATFITAVIRKNRQLTGFRIFTLYGGGSKHSVRDISEQELVGVLSQQGANASLANAKLNSEGKIEFTQGGLSAYPVLDEFGVLQGIGGLTVLYSVVDDNDTTLGYGIVDTQGAMANVSKKKLISLSNRYKMTNWETYALPTGGYNIRAKSGTFPKVVKATAVKVNTVNSKLESEDEINRKNAENEIARKKIEAQRDEAIEADKLAHAEEDDRTVVTEINVDETGVSSEVILLGSDKVLPCLKVYNLHDCFESEYNTSAQKKLASIKSNLRKVSPYYASMFEAIKKIPCLSIGTMGVTEDTLYYNPQFLASLSVPEATFIYIHEMLHIALQHSLRHGNRDNYLWNIACDLYINELICKEFGCVFGEGVATCGFTSALDGKTYTGEIATYNSGIYLSTIGESLDFGTDTAERIYARLVEENPELVNKGGQQGGQSNQGSQGGQPGGAPSQGGQSSDQSDGQGGQQGNQQDGQGGQQGGQDGDQQGQGGQQGSQQGQSGQPSGQSGDQQGQGSQPGGQGGQSGQGSGGDFGGDDAFAGSGQGVSNTEDSTLGEDLATSENKEYKTKTVPVKVKINGRELTGEIQMDVYSSNDNPNPDGNDRSSILSKTKEVLSRIKIKGQMDKVEQSQSRGTGSGALVAREIDFALTVSYNWQQILKNLVNTKPKKTFTMAMPNVDYMNAGITVAGHHRIGKATGIKGLKVCVDTSGSIGTKELNIIFAKITQILNYYEVSAELIYWDTSVNNVGEFENIKQLRGIKAQGGGGTDIRCVFDFLLGKTKCNGKTTCTKPRDISGVLIFTDGCIDNDYGDYARAFGNKTIWIIDEGSPAFKPLFGKVARAKLK